MAIKGRDFNFFGLIGSVYEKNCTSTNFSINVVSDIDETTTKTTGSWKTFDFSGPLSYTCEVSLIVTFDAGLTMAAFQNAQITKTKLPFTAKDDNSIAYNGRLLILQTTWDSPHDGICTGTVSLQGDGILQIITGDNPPSTVDVDIIDQFSDLVASVPAPGVYQVLRFDTISQGGAANRTPDLIIIPAS